MNKIEIIELFNKNNIDTVGIAPIGPYEELKKVLEDKVNKNLITGMEEPDIEKRINPKLYMNEGKTIISIAFPYLWNNDYVENGFSKYTKGLDYHRVVKSYLDKIGIESKIIGETGVVATLINNLNYPTIALRAEIDVLLI